MPPKKKVELPEDVRKALLVDVRLSHQAAIEADERDKIRIYLAVEQGATTYELAEELDVSQQTVSNWRRQGEEAHQRREQARDRRRDEGSGRPGELVPNC